MSIAVRCSQCAQGFSAPDKLAGKRVKCPKCGAAVAIPPPVVEEPEIDLLDDKLSIPSSIDAFAPAAPVTLRPAAALPTSPSGEIRRTTPSPQRASLKRFAPALEMIGVLVFGCGLYGLFAHLLLHYTSTWSDLGVVFMLGGGVLFGLAQALNFDGERLPRTLGVLFFFCIIAASIGAGIEMAGGRMNSNSLKFWQQQHPETAFIAEVDGAFDGFVAVLAKINSVETANEYSAEMIAVDARLAQVGSRGKELADQLTDEQMQRILAHTKTKSQSAIAAGSAEVKRIALLPGGAKVLEIVFRNMPNARNASPERFARIDSAINKAVAGNLQAVPVNRADQVYQEYENIDNEFLAILSRIRDQQSAQQSSAQLAAVDTRFSDFSRRAKSQQFNLTSAELQTLGERIKAKKTATTEQTDNQLRQISRQADGPAILRVIVQSMPQLIGANPTVLAKFNKLIAESESTQTGRGALANGSGQAKSSLTSAEQRRKEVEARHKEMADRMAKQIEAARNRLSSGATSTAASRPAPKSSNPFSTFTGSSSNAGKEKISLHGRGLRESAESEFDWHRDAAGQVLLQAAALAGSDEALKPQLQWSPALKRPAFSLYWGIGVSQEPMGDAPPIDDRWKNVRRSLEARRRDPSWQQVDEFKKRTGDVGAGLAEGLQQRINHREFGDWGAESNRSSRELRGLVLLEPGTLGWAVQEAHGLGLDVLAIFHLQDKKSAAGPYTEMQINIVRASDGRSLWHSEVLSDRKLRNARKKGDDPAADLVASAFAFIDKELRLTKMPAVKPEVAKKRAEKLADDPLIEPIAAIFEIRYYQVQGLLTDDEAQALYEKKVGAEVAEALATGDEDERNQAITSYFSK